MKKMSATMSAKMNATLRLASLVLASLILCNISLAQQPPDNVEGDWTIYSTNIGNGKLEVKHVQIQQYGNRIAGYFQGPKQSGPIQGRIDVHHIMFNTLTRNILTFRGEIYGNQIQGLYVLHNRRAPWQAVRTSQPLPATGAVYNSEPISAPPVTESAYSAPTQQYSAPTQQYSAPAQQYSSPTQQDSGPQQYSAPSQWSANDSSQTSAPPTQSGPPTPAPLSADQLNSLVAPIALYPDALVAQVLAAAANPDEVTYADDWLAQNRNLTGQALAQEVDQQSWDPSVKALTQFPSVLDNLAHNLSWTSSLGQAFANQQADVMAAVQAMRAKAQAAGTLQSNSQITVTQSAPSTIVIQPSNPQVVYVPQYNPTLVYGAPIVVPYYVAPTLPVASVGIYFGAPITIGAWFGGGGWGGGFGWGWHAWGLHWGCCGGGGSTTIIYNHNTYINNHTWNNRNYNGYHPWANNSGYHPGADTHYGPNGDYHPNGYYGPNGHFHHDVPGTNPSGQPNGGHNGDHGLIGGNGGVQHPDGTPHADGSKWGDRGPNGGNNGDHGMIGGNGGVQHSNGTVPHADGSRWGDRGPNGGNNGDHGMIGGNGGVQRTSGDDRGRNSRMSGDGRANRMESNRGRGSMGGRRSQPHMARMHAPAEHHSGGGGRRR
ncbi:MAG: DUF3300 domain-containing protein [Terriglobales bacterium]|jgi:hypothetical protein